MSQVDENALVMDPDLAKNQWPSKMDKATNRSLSAKLVTKEMFARLKDTKSPQGWTLARSINTGVQNPDSFVGCHVGDLESYHVFKELFHPVIEAYHVGFKMDGSMKHVTDIDPAKMKISLNDNAKSKIISCRIRCARNLTMFPMNTVGTQKSREDVAGTVEKILGELTGENADLAGDFYRHSTMTPEQERQLIDDHFLFRGRDRMQSASGYHQFWPHGRGIFCSKDKKFLMWVNEGDHLRIISMEQGGDVLSVFTRLSRGVRVIENGLRKIAGRQDVFLSDPIIGMATCCPSNIGTGMRGSVHILVPKLIKKIGFEKIDEMARTMNCQARGSSGEHSAVVDRIDISNWRRLGYPEYQLIEDMIRCVNTLAQMEDEA